MKKIIMIIIIILIVIMCLALTINFSIIIKENKKIISKEDAKNIDNIDCILILGAGIWGDKPSPMLEDRLLEGINLYKQGVSKKIIMSGDHSTENYDEVNIMKDFAIEKGVPSEDIFMDHAGFSTYESIYRVKEIFGCKKIIIVTQKYHLYRALYIADKFDVESYGVNSDPRQYAGQFLREIREILARDKDFLKCIFKPNPTYLGETIQVSGNGDITNDK